MTFFRDFVSFGDLFLILSIFFCTVVFKDNEACGCDRAGGRAHSNRQAVEGGKGHVPQEQVQMFIIKT